MVVQIHITSHKRHVDFFFPTKCFIDPVTLEQVPLEQSIRTDIQLGKHIGLINFENVSAFAGN